MTAKRLTALLLGVMPVLPGTMPMLLGVAPVLPEVVRQRANSGLISGFSISTSYCIFCKEKVAYLKMVSPPMFSILSLEIHIYSGW